MRGPTVIPSDPSCRKNVMGVRGRKGHKTREQPIPQNATHYVLPLGLKDCVRNWNFGVVKSPVLVSHGSAGL